MQVFDLLSEREQHIIGRYISAYGDYNGGSLYGRAPVEDILRYWNGAKSGFLSSVMGNQLILERRVNIQTPESIIWERIEDMIYPDNGNKRIEFLRNYYKWADKTFDYEIYDLVSQIPDIACLSKNSYLYDSFEIPVPGRHPIQVNKGCKVMKVLGKIAQTFNIEGFEDFRLKHSMILNQQRFQGTLCLSIHPLDYMTMSDNDCDWDSCMSWMKPGEYREGTVEMMNSPYVIVAYLRAEKDMYLFPDCRDDKVEWNNKRWRELFVVSPDVITGIRGYPYCDDILENEIFKWLLELVRMNCSWVHYDEPIKFSPGEFFNYRDNKICVGFSFNIMYNDFGYDHTGYFVPTVLDKLSTHGYYNINLSGENVCMECGELYLDWENWDTQSLVCPRCTGEVKCAQCGTFLSEEEAIWVGDDPVCDYCADNYVRECARCGDLNFIENTTPVYLSQEGELLRDSPFHVCDCCKESYSQENLDECFGRFGKVMRNNPFWSTQVTAIDVEDLTLDGFSAFGYYAETLEEAREMVKSIN